MKWSGRQGSGNVEDRRGMGGRVAIGGGLGGLVILLLTMFFGDGNFSPDDLNVDNGVSDQQSYTPTGEENEKAQFVSVVLKDTEDVWHQLIEAQGGNYTEPGLVLFTNSTDSGCGYASAATGPFYCPTDSKVYIDLSFYDDLQSRFGAPGDFAMAYVVAHEVGHHIQNLMGTTGKLDAQRGRINEKQMNALSVKLELQADFYAGVWAHHAQEMKNILEPGDIEEALNAANAIGDDRLQRQSQGYVVPDAFTHGTSKQRMYWFKKGFDTGDLSQGNTFEEIQ
ncbi:MAG TPA: neutral zinc metallopeptidase [Cyclobacteriaceae bacterium]|nr:neutral zinc metallopeptidase [Cyclobacteriaceae bacterium]